MQHGAGGGADGHGEAVRDGVVDGDELAVEGPQLLPLTLAHLDGLGGDAVLLELGLDEGQREARPDHRDVGTLAQQVGHSADVVLVAVGEHHRVDLVETIPDPGVREDDVDARLVLLGEQHAAVDDHEATRVLEDRHVAADLAESSQRHHSQTVRRQRGQAAGALAPGTAPAHGRAAVPAVAVCRGWGTAVDHVSSLGEDG